MRSLTCAFMASVLIAPSSAGITQVVLFTGFGAGPGPNTGMDLLNSRLATAGIDGYLGQVFEWNEHAAAFDWVEEYADGRTTLVLIGHSFGGNSTLQLAGDYISPLIVDLTIQIDPVKNFISGSNNILPVNVEVGFNYYQISTSFFEPQGEDFVAGATNINVEVLFNDTAITHTSIDDDRRLHSRIAENILANLNPASADFDGDGDVDGVDFMAWQRGESTNAMSRSDLYLWQSQYATVSPTASALPLPETATGQLALVAFLVTQAFMVHRRGSMTTTNRTCRKLCPESSSSANSSLERVRRRLIKSVG